MVPHQATAFEPETFGVAIVEAAFSQARFLFVGPTGHRGHLEASALKMKEFHPRPRVLFNYLTIKHRVHGGPPPPTLEEVQAVLAEHGGLRVHLRRTARLSVETSVEQTTVGNDVNNVHTLSLIHI